MERQINIYEVVNQEVERSNIKRLNWSALLGKSLTKYVANGKARGLSPEMVITSIVKKHPYLTEDAKRRLKISVCSRFAEIKSETQEAQKINEFLGVKK